MVASAFPGFPPATIAFLEELEQNNDRAWFQANKHRYESDVLDPALQFIAAMAEPLRGISPYFLAVPKRTGLMQSFPKCRRIECLLLRADQGSS